MKQDNNEITDEYEEFDEEIEEVFEPLDETDIFDEIITAYEPKDEPPSHDIYFDHRIKQYENKNNEKLLQKIYTNKFNVISNIYNGKYKSSCSKCNSKINFLQIIDFHHKDSRLKKTTWRMRSNKDWKKTIEIFEKEKVIPLCKNCHSSEQAKIFNKYIEIFLRENLFDKSAENIDKILQNEVATQESNYNRNIKFRLTEWVKKYSVIEQLYNGKCIGYKNIKSNLKLPALQFHHRSGSKKADQKLKWINLKKYDIKTICIKLQKEDCVCLCANCHAITHSRDYNEIGTLLLGKTHIQKANKIKFQIDKNIQYFKFEIRNLRNPLQKEFEYGDAWRKYLIQIQKLSEKNIEIKTSTLARSVRVNARNTRKNIQKLITRGLIVVKGENTKRKIILTEAGKEILGII